MLEGLGVEDPLQVLLASIPLNLYALSAVALAAYSIARNYNRGPMAAAQARADRGELVGLDVVTQIEEKNAVKPRAANMLVPVLTLVLAMPLGLWITGTAGEASEELYQADLTGARVIVMGAEGKGMRRLTRECCDNLVKIPMCGEVSSLNVSVATGVILFELLRQRQAYPVLLRVLSAEQAY